MVAAVHNVQNILCVDGDPRGAIEFTVIAPSCPPLAQEVAIFIENGDAVEPFVGNVDVLLAIQRKARGPYQLPRPIAGAGEIGDELLIARHRADGELPDAGS